MPEFYGLTEADLDEEITLSPGFLPQFASANVSTMTLREIIANCEKLYCRSIGAEYLHVATREEREWIRERLETPVPYQFDPEEKKRILDRLMWTTTFEKFMSAKFPNDKRFSTEGVESQVPALKAIIDASAENGVERVPRNHLSLLPSRKAQCTQQRRSETKRIDLQRIFRRLAISPSNLR
jgi:2-oxoglutarate dehydrogenase E1 component